MRRPFVWDRASRGQGVVEFALVSLVLLMLVFGTIDLGRGIYQRMMLTNAVREGARYGMVNQTQRIASGSNNAYRDGIVAAAANTSPTLNLTLDNFGTTNGHNGFIGCRTWAPAPGEGSFGYCGQDFAMPQNQRLKVCATYRFAVSASYLIKVPPIVMRECSTVSLK